MAPSSQCAEYPAWPFSGHTTWCRPLLRCPVYLNAAAGALVCRNRHGFDLAREGYANLLRDKRRQPASSGDSPDQDGSLLIVNDVGSVDAVVGVRSHREVLRVYLMDADIEKLVEFLSRKAD